MHHGTSRGKPKRIPRAGSAMTRRRGSAMTHHDLIRMTVDSRVLGHPQSRQINPNRGPSRAPTGLDPPPRPTPHTIANCDSYHASALHPTLATSSDGPPALVAHSPYRVSPALFGRDAVKARDALLGQCPLGQPRGVRRRGYSPGHRPRDAHSVETTPDV